MVLDPELQALGPRLKALRERVGLNRSALARRSDLNLQHLMQLENGRRSRNPRLLTFIHLARGLGLTLHQLLVELFPPP
jgi:transcriptional regulator with XRE-family HTH domain